MGAQSSKTKQRYAMEKGKKIYEEEILSRPGVREYLQVHGQQWYKPKNKENIK